MDNFSPETPQAPISPEIEAPKLKEISQDAKDQYDKYEDRVDPDYRVSRENIEDAYEIVQKMDPAKINSFAEFVAVNNQDIKDLPESERSEASQALSKTRYRELLTRINDFERVVRESKVKAGRTVGGDSARRKEYRESTDQIEEYVKDIHQMVNDFMLSGIINSNDLDTTPQVTSTSGKDVTERTGLRTKLSRRARAIGAGILLVPIVVFGGNKTKNEFYNNYDQAPPASLSEPYNRPGLADLGPASNDIGGRRLGEIPRLSKDIPPTPLGQKPETGPFTPDLRPNTMEIPDQNDVGGTSSTSNELQNGKEQVMFDALFGPITFDGQQNINFEQVMNQRLKEYAQKNGSSVDTFQLGHLAYALDQLYAKVRSDLNLGMNKLNETSTPGEDFKKWSELSPENAQKLEEIKTMIEATTVAATTQTNP